jgi:hypothetical protein
MLLRVFRNLRECIRKWLFSLEREAKEFLLKLNNLIGKGDKPHGSAVGSFVLELTSFSSKSQAF